MFGDIFNAFKNMWMQQDGTTSHTALLTIISLQK